MLFKALHNSFSKIETEPKQKTSFWATDTEKSKFDLYHAWIGTTPTNPPNWQEKLRWYTRAKVEEGFVQLMKEQGLAKETQRRIEITIGNEPINISGYIDLIDIDDNPVEVKTFYGDWQKKDLLTGRPKTSYLKQLATYMYAEDKTKGVLIYFEMGDAFEKGKGEIFEFELLRVSTTKFRCRHIEFDLKDTFVRWHDVYYNYVLKNIEPPIEYIYKYPINTIDWSTVSASKIQKARNNQAVIGDWEVLYSPYKNLIIEKQGECLGYSEEEIKKISELTKGYTTWNKTKLLIQ